MSDVAEDQLSRLATKRSAKVEPSAPSRSDESGKR